MERIWVKRYAHLKVCILINNCLVICSLFGGLTLNHVVDVQKVPVRIFLFINLTFYQLEAFLFSYSFFWGGNFLHKD